MIKYFTLILVWFTLGIATAHAIQSVQSERPVGIGEESADTPLEDPKLEARARALMGEIRCLVCQNQAIDESNAELAQDLRTIVRTQMAAGQSEDDVKAYLVSRYGDWVLLKPPVDARTWLLWLSPVLFLLLGGIWLMLHLRRNSSSHTNGTNDIAVLNSNEQAELDTILRATTSEQDTN